MRTVHKYRLDFTQGDLASPRLPAAAQVLSVGHQGNNLYLWALVEPDGPIDLTRVFRIAGTGHPIEGDDDLRFLGTAHMQGGALVLHVFEVLQAAQVLDTPTAQPAKPTRKTTRPAAV